MAALAGEVAVLKPQSAFFERHGSAGIAVLERVIGAAREAGALVLLDAKRGDIGSTMAAYAQAYLTAGPRSRRTRSRCRPTSGSVRWSRRWPPPRRTAAGCSCWPGRPTRRVPTCSRRYRRGGAPSVAQAVVDAAAQRNAGNGPLGAVGVVVGATVEHGLDLAALNGPVLAPGFGAQGATPGDLSAYFPRVAGPVLPTVSRDLLRTGPNPGALRDAACRLRDAFAADPDGHAP